jgi:hypothetical protein
MHLFLQLINEIQWGVLGSTMNQNKATAHTCMLRKATKLIISK